MDCFDNWMQLLNKKYEVLKCQFLNHHALFVAIEGKVLYSSYLPYYRDIKSVSQKAAKEFESVL